MIFLQFLGIVFGHAIALCGQDSGRSRQDFGKILTGAAKILSNSLHIRERQECSGVRRSSRQRTTIKTIKMYMKIGAVDLWAAADNRPPTPRSHRIGLWAPTSYLQHPNPRQIVRCLGKLTHARSYL